MLKLPLVSLFDSYLFIVFLALITHFIYNKFEAKVLGLRESFVLLGALPLLSSVFLTAQHFSKPWTVAVPVSFALFYATLALSIIVYRISPFHPLAEYPGPLMAKISKFWGVSVAATGKQHKLFRELQVKYGDWVRIGPNELLLLDACAIMPVLGPAGMPKGPLWEGRSGLDGFPTLIGIRNREEHTRRRKLWNRAFSTSSVKSYEPLVIKRALQLAEVLEENCKSHQPINLAKWLSFFAFDFMGDMSFGGGFELMSEGDARGMWGMMESAIDVLILMQNVPWLARILYGLPLPTKNAARFFDFARDQVSQRKQRGSSHNDLFHYLIDEDGLEKEPPSFTQIVADGSLAIGAGSDTTATVLAGIFYYLLAHPEYFSRLQAEVDSVFPPGEVEPFDSAKLADMQYLNAVINETLRVQPAVHTCVQRAPELGSGGHWVGQRLIPEGTAVFIPPYVLHRDPRYFSPRPDEFWPDRWLKIPDSTTGASADGSDTLIVTDTDAFIPFSFGPANCAGKNLALVEMRMVVALLVQRFEMAFEDGYDQARWSNEIEDKLVSKTGPLPVVLKPRLS